MDGDDSSIVESLDDTDVPRLMAVSEAKALALDSFIEGFKVARNTRRLSPTSRRTAEQQFERWWSREVADSE